MIIADSVPQPILKPNHCSSDKTIVVGITKIIHVIENNTMSGEQRNKTRNLNDE